MEHLETFLSCFKQEYNSPCRLHIISSHRNVLISTFYGHFRCPLQVRGDFRLAPQNPRDFTGPLFHNEARRFLISARVLLLGKLHERMPLLVVNLLLSRDSLISFI